VLKALFVVALNLFAVALNVFAVPSTLCVVAPFVVKSLSAVAPFVLKALFVVALNIFAVALNIFGAVALNLFAVALNVFAVALNLFGAVALNLFAVAPFVPKARFVGALNLFAVAPFVLNALFVLHATVPKALPALAMNLLAASTAAECVVASSVPFRLDLVASSA